VRAEAHQVVPYVGAYQLHFCAVPLRVDGEGCEAARECVARCRPAWRRSGRGAGGSQCVMGCNKQHI
jgi:hypothetical protein